MSSALARCLVRQSENHLEHRVELREGERDSLIRTQQHTDYHTCKFDWHWHILEKNRKEVEWGRGSINILPAECNIASAVWCLKFAKRYTSNASVWWWEKNVNLKYYVAQLGKGEDGGRGRKAWSHYRVESEGYEFLKRGSESLLQGFFHHSKFNLRKRSIARASSLWPATIVTTTTTNQILVARRRIEAEGATTDAVIDGTF